MKDDGTQTTLSPLLRLLVIHSPRLPKFLKIDLLPELSYHIGRERLVAESFGTGYIRIPDVTVSRHQHALFNTESTIVGGGGGGRGIPTFSSFVTDLGSTSGTFVNGKRIASHSPTPIQHFTKIQIGRTIFEVHLIPKMKSNVPNEITLCMRCDLHFVYPVLKDKDLGCFKVKDPKKRKKASQTNIHALETHMNSGFEVPNVTLPKVSETHRTAEVHEYDSSSDHLSDTDESHIKLTYYERLQRLSSSKDPNFKLPSYLLPSLPTLPASDKKSSLYSNIAINDSNVGYKMLQKLGWKPGKGLGIDESGGLDPLPIIMKNDLSGLGMPRKP